MAKVFVSLSSNIARHDNISRAVAALTQQFGHLQISTTYESAAIGVVGNEFYNVVLGFETAQSITQIHSYLRELEAAHGRIRSADKTAVVSLDADLLLYDNVVMDNALVHIPRPDIERYAFVLQPLAEIAADLIHPIIGKSYQVLWQEFDKTAVKQKPVDNFLPQADPLEKHFASLILAIGEDINREGLLDTPKRAAKAFRFLNNGYEKNLDEVLNGAIFTADTEDMVIVKNIELYSLCEHHLLPFLGKCHIAYLPAGKVLGLSKLARIVDMYARRLQIQEKLTKQIADAVQSAINARGVAVVIEAQHLCMMMRGVEKQNSVMTTSVMLGTFRQHISTRAEFLSLVNNHRTTPFG